MWNDGIPNRKRLIPASSTPAQPTKAASPKLSGIDAFPSLDEPSGGNEVRVTGVAGTGEDEDRAQFESAFPDLSSEVGYEAVSWCEYPGETWADHISRPCSPHIKNESSFLTPLRSSLTTSMTPAPIPPPAR